MVSPEEFNALPLQERAKKYALDVLATENEPVFLRITGQIVGGSNDGSHDFGYQSRPGEFTYSFLAGPGSLGHPHKPTVVGEAVYKIAELLEAKVDFLDFTFARFNKQLTQESIIEAFTPLLESIG